jgi:hypothetical protein
LWNTEYVSPRLPTMCAARQTTAEDSFWKKVWSDIEPAARAIVGDTGICLLILASLAVVYLCLGWLAGLGYDDARIERLDVMHYWATVAVLGVFLLSFVIRMGLQALRPRK